MLKIILLLLTFNVYISSADDATIGSPKSLICSCYGEGYIWKKSDNSVTFTRIYDNNKYSGSITRTITINNVDFWDYGYYRCQCYTGQGWYVESATQLNLVVVAEKGSTVILNCQLTVNVFQWLKHVTGGYLLLNSGTKYVGTDTPNLQILNVGESDSGLYRCTTQSTDITVQIKDIGNWATWGEWSQCSTTCGNSGTRTRQRSCGVSYCHGSGIETDNTCPSVECPEAPRVNIPNDNYVGKYGDQSITLGCNVLNGGNATLSWQKDNTNLGSLNSKYTIGEPGTSLQIHNLIVSDKGLYRCMVQSKIGFGSSNDITELKIVRTISTTSKYDKTANESVTLHCEILDATKVYWLHNGKEIMMDNVKYRGGLITRPSLDIVNLTRSDRGTYICISSYDTVQMRGDVITVVVYDVPYVEVVPGSIEVATGLDITVPCNFDEHDNPTSVHWTKDGKRLSPENDKYNGSSITYPSLIIFKYSNTDSGYYTCFVTNNLGISSGQPIRLQVKGIKQSSSNVSAIIGGTVSSVLILVIITILLLVKKRTTQQDSQPSDYEIRDMTKVDVHVYGGRNDTSTYYNTEHDEVQKDIREKDVSLLLKRYCAAELTENIRDDNTTKMNIEMEFQHLQSSKANTNGGNDFDVVKADNKSDDQYKDYANFVNTSSIQPAANTMMYYIASIPQQNQIESFWNMVESCEVENIILLVQRKEKISEFYSTTEDAFEIARYKIELLASEKLTNIFLYTVKVKNQTKRSVKEVKIFKMVNWKPKDTYPPDELLFGLLDDFCKTTTGPTIILGSPTIGTCVGGAFSVCLQLAHAMKEDRLFNILETAVEVKNTNKHLFQNIKEYQMCYKLITYYLESQHMYDYID